MSQSGSKKEAQKKASAEKAVEFLSSGMVVGLGTGSTAKYAIESIGRKLASGELKDILGIPTSHQSEVLAIAAGIPLTTFDSHQRIDCTIDGADEVDSDLNLIKGGGGALLREKICAQASENNIMVVDKSKLSRRLGANWAVPVETFRYSMKVEQEWLRQRNAAVTIRTNQDGSFFDTDEGNVILDADFGEIFDPAALAAELDARGGIASHGLFIGTAGAVIVADDNGVHILNKGSHHDAFETLLQ